MYLDSSVIVIIITTHTVHETQAQNSCSLSNEIIILLSTIRLSGKRRISWLYIVFQRCENRTTKTSLLFGNVCNSRWYYIRAMLGTSISAECLKKSKVTCVDNTISCYSERHLDEENHRWGGRKRRRRFVQITSQWLYWYAKIWFPFCALDMLHRMSKLIKKKKKNAGAFNHQHHWLPSGWPTTEIVGVGGLIKVDTLRSLFTPPCLQDGFYSWIKNIRREISHLSILESMGKVSWPRNSRSR